jgi:hypothetical protein
MKGIKMTASTSTSTSTSTTGYIANLNTANSLTGTTVGNGQCEAFVQQVSSVPHPAMWCQGAKVKSASFIAPGTVIAIFDADGKYRGRATRSAHAAIFLSRNVTGIWVLDQCASPAAQPVQKRLIRYMSGVGTKSGDGDQFCIVT